MKIYHPLIAIIFLSLTLTGCLTVKEGEYKYDIEKGLFEVTFHDIRSEKQSEDNSNHVEKDWADLQDALKKKDDFDPAIVRILAKDLFQEGKVLSAKILYQVNCPKCYGNPGDILKILNSDGRWEVINDEVLLFFQKGKLVVSTNGKLVQTEKNTICAWPLDSRNFEYKLTYGYSDGVSLLDKYLADKKATPETAPMIQTQQKKKRSK
jgi:hypothetical protein